MRAFLSAVLVGSIVASVSAQGVWENALKRAKSERKYVLAHFADPECFTCQRYMAQTVDNPQLSPLLRHFITVKMDAVKEVQKLREFLPKWKEPFPLPVTVIVDSNGKLVDLIVGHLNADAFAAFLKAFLKGKRTDTVEKQLKEKPKDLSTLYEAAVWFLERGDGRRGLPLAQKVLQLDPDNRKGYYAPMRLHLGLYYSTHHTQLAHKAIDEFREVIKRFPNTREAEEARFYLAVTHLALGQDADAKKMLQEILRTSKSALLKEHARRLLRFLETEPPADLRRGEGD
ncbi:MAG: tetratricopeptide repeat protein [Armatimonadetes bacterium]|nr:tetratricopeptide repeat protein [Armatimonadota bacterium]MCX7967152.1 tetratricopeptide repeat protein [Armatimonadota bacterium]MDW8141948.1 tetratricopeptide repeat protein [Armatimonadota bacterium]